MTTISFPARGLTATYLVSEAEGMYRSRDEIIVASGSGKLPSGMVLGRVTATGKYVPFAPAASDGSQTAAAILFDTIDATAADVRVTASLRDCEVQRAALSFSGSPTTNQKNAAYASLAALGIIMR